MYNYYPTAPQLGAALSPETSRVAQYMLWGAGIGGTVGAYVAFYGRKKTRPVLGATHSLGVVGALIGLMFAKG